MEEKKHCKWYHEEFCANDNSPFVADYCPVYQCPEVCRFFEKEKPEETDMVFSCRKCGHLLFVTTKDKKCEDIARILMQDDCPSCGEGSYENWIFVRMGNYGEEYGKNE